jgi:hypothetical protein
MTDMPQIIGVSLLKAFENRNGKNANDQLNDVCRRIAYK